MNIVIITNGDKGCSAAFCQNYTSPEIEAVRHEEALAAAAALGVPPSNVRALPRNPPSQPLLSLSLSLAHTAGAPPRLRRWWSFRRRLQLGGPLSHPLDSASSFSFGFGRCCAMSCCSCGWPKQMSLSRFSRWPPKHFTCHFAPFHVAFFTLSLSTLPPISPRYAQTQLLPSEGYKPAPTLPRPLPCCLMALQLGRFGLPS